MQYGCPILNRRKVQVGRLSAIDKILRVAGSCFPCWNETGVKAAFAQSEEIVVSVLSTWVISTHCSSVNSSFDERRGFERVVFHDRRGVDRDGFTAVDRNLCGAL